MVQIQIYRFMKKLLYTLFCVLFCTYGNSQERVSLDPKVIQIEFNSLKSSLSNTAVYYSDESRPNINSVGVLVDFFGINGNEKTYRIIETPVLSKEYSKDHPEFKSYTGLSTDGKTQVKISITPAGLTSVLIEAGKYYYIEKKTSGDVNEYELFDQSQIKGDAACGFNEVPTKVDGKKLRNSIGVLNTNGAQLRNYRIAIACTGEFTARNGGNVAGANSKINALLTLINARYETELSTTFTLVATNDNIVYSDAATDPFSPTGGSSASQSQNVFTNSLNTPSLMPYANYDIGQTLHYHDIPSLPAGALSASGQAGPTPCLDNSKSRSWTQYSEGTAGSATAAFITGIIIHEIGHQFSAWHTFNGSGSNCAPGTGQYDETAAYEPGSGNTIMSYNGICGSAYNLTGGKVDYFHARSLFQISSSLNGSAGSCITPTTNSGNNVPTANAGVDYTIPKSTPFVLTGTGSDTDTGDILSFTWDQYDQPVINDQGALGTLTGVGGYNAINSTTAPLFRTTQSGTGERTFPSLSFILNNSNAPANNEGEALSAVARDIDMRLVVRDNKVFGGAYDTDDVKITVADSGPFEVTTGNGATLWFVGTAPGITWNVNGTDAAPVSCANVKISTSIDGGATFTTLIASTPNDGSHPFTVPNTPSTQFRIKIEAVGNVFFDINDSDITISSGACTPENSTIVDNSSITETQGSGNLNLSLSSIGAQITSFTGSLDASDPGTNLVCDDGSGTCANYGNSQKYEIHEFIAVSNSNTTFTISGPLVSDMSNLYSNLYNNGSQCTNWITSSAILSGGFVNLNSSFSSVLVSGNSYVIRHSAFSDTNYGTYTITPSGGAIHNKVPASGSPFSFTYLIYDTVTGLITAFDPITDLSSFNAGSYRIYGLSYAGGANLNTYVNTTFTSFQTALGNGSECGLLSSNFKNVTITCGSLPSPPTVNSPTIPYNTSATLTASGCAGTVNWFDLASGGTQLLSGNSVSTPLLTSSVSYFAECNLGGCASATRSESIITVLPSPCANQLTLVSPTNDITTGTSTFESNNNAAGSNEGLISATNKITGGNTTFSAGKKVELLQGFEVSGAATVFKAEIGGCSN